MKLSIGHQFSTYDKDNDRLERSCAEDRTGAWWYNKCGQSNLNGDFKHEKVYGGIRWDTWVRSNHSLKAVEMKVRRH